MKKSLIVLSLTLICLGVASAQGTNTTENMTTDAAIVISNQSVSDGLIASQVSEKLGIPIITTQQDQITQESQQTIRPATKQKMKPAYRTTRQKTTRKPTKPETTQRTPPNLLKTRLLHLQTRQNRKLPYFNLFLFLNPARSR